MRSLARTTPAPRHRTDFIPGTGARFPVPSPAGKGGPSPEKRKESAENADMKEMAACLQAVGDRKDRQAFETLFRYYGPRVKAMIMRAGAAPQQAEETMQETMVLIWRKAGLFDPAKASASTWIYTIARNKRYDLLRREKHPELDPEDPFFSDQGAEPDGEEVVTQTERGEIIRAHLSGLPAEQLLLVKKAFYEDMTHQAIAAELNIPLGTVKSRIRIALRGLREKLSGVEI